VESIRTSNGRNGVDEANGNRAVEALLMPALLNILRKDDTETLARIMKIVRVFAGRLTHCCLQALYAADGCYRILATPTVPLEHRNYSSMLADLSDAQMLRVFDDGLCPWHAVPPRVENEHPDWISVKLAKFFDHIGCSRHGSVWNVVQRDKRLSGLFPHQRRRRDGQWVVEYIYAPETSILLNQRLKMLAEYRLDISRPTYCALLLYMVFIGDKRLLYMLDSLHMQYVVRRAIAFNISSDTPAIASCPFHRGLYGIDNHIDWRLIYKSWMAMPSPRCPAAQTHADTPYLADMNMDLYHDWNRSVSGLCVMYAPGVMGGVWARNPVFLFPWLGHKDASTALTTLLLLLHIPAADTAIEEDAVRPCIPLELPAADTAIEEDAVRPCIPLELFFYLLSSLWIESVSSCTCRRVVQERGFMNAIKWFYCH
jgi:hypothetical protein